MTIQFDPSALAYRIRLLDAIGVGPLWLRRDAAIGAPAAVVPPTEAIATEQLQAEVESPTQVLGFAAGSAPDTAAWSDDGPATSIAARSQLKTILTIGTRTVAVAAGGNADTTRFLFIGRANSVEGAEELFDNILLASGLQKESQEQCELSAVGGQIAAHRPSALVLMDTDVAQHLSGSTEAGQVLRGSMQRICDVPAMLTFSVTHLLRHPADKRAAWDDLCALMAAVAGDVVNPA